ncbi:MAG TPA: hypothetical protein VF937_09565 [Chloroflexota bacterium]
MQRIQISSRSRLSLPRLLPQRNTFTAREVRRRLQVDTLDDPRTAAVHAAAAHTSLWAESLSDRLVLDLGRTAYRLPSVVFWYRQGVPAHEIGRRLSPFGGAWDANHALDVAAALIARALNRGALTSRAA